MKYRCEVCGVYEYDSEKGDGALEIEAGVKPENFDDNWLCPICQADKSHMILDE